MDRWAVLGLMDTLSRLAGKGDAEGYYSALNAAEKSYERELPKERRGSSWSGAADGEVIRAPWRGEGDMPGNFERGQRMGNSLANDALLRQGLAHKYEYDPEYGVDVTYQPGVPLGGPGGAKHNEAFTNSVHLSGPPDPAKMIQSPQSPGNWDPQWDWVGPQGPRTRGSLRAGGGFGDWIWDQLNRS